MGLVTLELEQSRSIHSTSVCILVTFVLPWSKFLLRQIIDMVIMYNGVHYFHHVCLSVRKYQRGSHWADLREI